MPLETDSTPGVLETVRPVMEQATGVRIDAPAVRRFVMGTPPAVLAYADPDPEGYLGLADGTPRTAQYVLVADAMNFCFWGEPKWSILVGDQRRDGWWGFVAALRRALQEEWPLLDAAWLREARAEDLQHIFRGEGELPFLAERAHHLREVGTALIERWGGAFANMVAAAEGSAVRLVRMIVETFPSFNDVARYRSQLVRFFKRAQITVADLAIAFRNQGPGKFEDLDQLTAFADYKLPQVLRREGILVYAPPLAARVDARRPIPAGSEAEIEIRAASVWAVELLRQGFAARGISLNAARIDEVLWHLGQRPDPRDRPYHRTRTIYY